MDETPVEISTATRRLILFGVAATTAMAAVGTAFLPYLLVEHPRVLLLLGADMRNLVLVGSTVDLVTLLGIGVPRRALGMVCTYGLGLLYGSTLVTWADKRLPRLAKVLRWAERTFARVSVLGLVFGPTYATSALAGATRMRLSRYAPAMVTGQLGFVTFSHYVGRSVSEWTDRLIALLAAYKWEATAVSATLVGAYQLSRWLRRRRAERRAGVAP